MKQKIIQAFAISAIAWGAQAADLNILTYDVIASDWGIGPIWEEKFEKQCGCDIEFEGVNGGSSAMVTRAMFDKGSHDIILGLDNSMMVDAMRLNLVQPHGIEFPELEVGWTDKYFVAFDYGFLAFVGLKNDGLPKTFDELVSNQDISVVMEDPKTSGFAHWFYGVYGDDSASKWAELSKHIVTITPSWSEAYKLFLEGEADVVMSYSTSPAYHVEYDKRDDYTALTFPEGHLLVVELGAITKESKNPVLAKEFLEFILTPEAQQDIALINIMYPIVARTPLPDAFKDLKLPKKHIYPIMTNQEISDLWVKDIAQ
ncbi:MAG: thiamine ABC transporter substrate binding subunit [Alphaproteobacteria bacterium]